MRRSAQPSRGGSRGGTFSDWVTQNPVLALIVVNIVFYIATNLSHGLVGRLGLTPALLAHRPWTILTAMFVHADFWHIFGNMITLFFFGRALTQIIGTNRFLAIYFIGGIIGNLLYYLIELHSLSPVIGASGAVFAVAVALAVLVPNMQVRIYFVLPVPLWISVLIFFGIWSIPNLFPGIAWQAHLGGLATGLVAGFLLRRTGRYYYFR